MKKVLLIALLAVLTFCPIQKTKPCTLGDPLGWASLIAGIIILSQESTKGSKYKEVKAQVESLVRQLVVLREEELQNEDGLNDRNVRKLKDIESKLQLLLQTSSIPSDRGFLLKMLADKMKPSTAKKWLGAFLIGCPIALSTLGCLASCCILAGTGIGGGIFARRRGHC